MTKSRPDQHISSYLKRAHFASRQQDGYADWDIIPWLRYYTINNHGR